MRPLSVVTLISLTLFTFSLRADDVTKLPSLKDEVKVYFDQHSIPHIYAKSWQDAYRVLGAIHARERLLQMEFNRRVSSGTLAELLGPNLVASDKLMRQIGLRRSCQESWDKLFPAETKNDFLAYAEGVNDAVKAIAGSKDSPLPFEPAPWNPVDSLTFMKYMGWDQGGTSDDLWFGRVVDELGLTATDELWPLERPYEIPIVTRQADRNKFGNVASLTTQADAAVVRSTVNPVLLAPFPPVTAARRLIYEQARSAIESAHWIPHGHNVGSNNWAVDGTMTKSGKPILCSDPHLGFRLPSIWYACHLCVNGENIVGVTFPGSPIIVIGHNDRIGWGITNMQADAVDYFIEKFKEDDPQSYMHRGTWKKVEVIKEQIAVKGDKPVEFIVEKTIHGPVISRDGEAISMQWTGMEPTTDAIGLWKLNRAKNLKEYLAALDLVCVPALNIVYADVDGNIAIHPMGKLPIRGRGAGRVPMDGSTGENDWNGWIPRESLPLAINPSEHFVASANSRPHPLGFPYYLGWMWDDSYRTRRIHEMLTPAKNLTTESMKKIQNDATDYAAVRILPVLLQGLKKAPPKDPFAVKVHDALASWDKVSSPDAVAPLLWLQWFENYRKGVWDDEWPARNIPVEGGSWGFNGNNKREPMLEVLEFLTREAPDSHWFDDLRTPTRETRDDVIVASFNATIEELKKKHGTDLSKYAWKNFNYLQIGSLTGEPSLDRKGGPVPGDDFTVNPGGDGGPVGGGACWRMIVDFADPSQSIGVYPGGQSGNPASDHYADLMPLWEKGEYAPLHMVGKADALPKEAKAKSETFAP